MRRLDAGGLCRGNLMVQRRERWLQQRAVERTEQGEARGATWSSTASVSITSCLDQVLPLDIGGHFKQSHHTSHLSSIIPLPQVLWRQASGEATGVGTLAVVVATLHTGSLSTERSSSGFRQPSEQLSSPLQDRTAHLHSMRKGLEKVP